MFVCRKRAQSVVKEIFICLREEHEQQHEEEEEEEDVCVCLLTGLSGSESAFYATRLNCLRFEFCLNLRSNREKGERIRATDAEKLFDLIDNRWRQNFSLFVLFVLSRAASVVQSHFACTSLPDSSLR